MTRVDRVIGPPDLPRVLQQLPDDGTPVHVHVTDKLFGASPEQAREVLTRLASSAGLSVTLHDLPQRSDGPRSLLRRAACYAAVARASRRVIVSSEHERLLLVDCLGAAGLKRAGEVVVIPLPIDAATSIGPDEANHPPDLAMVGFVYPGKGHEEVLAALCDLPADIGLLLLGCAASGHDDLVDAMVATARQLERRLVVTGYLPDDELYRRLRTAAVPVAAHRHVSASGSINSWLAAGRRPLVPRNRYNLELADRLPGTLTLYDELVPALRAALADPASTRLGPGATLGPSTAEVAARYRAALVGGA